ncbi:MAG: 7-carboxy-7-deazaguanine synthase QueE [Candidatus Margulisiibacteriota bacterium]
MSSIVATLSEVFNSFQGEGVYVGERQTFVRFAGCNLTCQYCDTPNSQAIVSEYKIEKQPGSRQIEKKNNPVNCRQLIDLISVYEKPKAVSHSVCLTGGEPLLQVDFLKQFLPLLKEEIKLPIYLETNGVLPDHLNEIIDQVDIIACDIKLPSATGLSGYFEEHKKFLEIAQMQNVFVKIVFTADSHAKEIDEAVSVIAGVSPEIALVLQPVTPHGAIKHRPTLEQYFAFYNIAKRKLKSVRLIPQTHKALGIA